MEYLMMMAGSVVVALVVMMLVQGSFVPTEGAINESANAAYAYFGVNVTGGLACSDCDAYFVSQGEPNSITSGMLRPDSVDSSKIMDGSIGYVDVNTGEIQRRVSDFCPDGSAARKIFENGSVLCDTASWIVNGNNQYARTAGNVGIGTASPQAKLHVNGTLKVDGAATVDTLNVVTALNAPGMGAGSVNITFLNATQANVENLTVRNVYVIDNANVGIGLTATQLTARSGITAPGFSVSSSVTNVNSLYAQQLCMRRSGPSSSYVCINYWTDLLNVLYAQVG